MLVDGHPVHSCDTPVWAVAGKQVTTVEGLSGHPLQETFVEEQALQCGYCTSGMVVTAAALLEREPDVDEDGVRRALDGNLCRCGRPQPDRAGGARREAVRAMTSPSLENNPRLGRWLTIDPAGRVLVRSGKVELGQGVLTALAQIVADELDVDPARVEMVAASTDESPDESYTAGSLSVQHSGTALRAVVRAGAGPAPHCGRRAAAASRPTA